jgi:hypothetical protein
MNQNIIQPSMHINSPTKVVNYHKDNFDIWIGRNKWQGTLGWGNPFIIGADGNRDECISKYRIHLLTNVPLLAKIEKLRGKILGCGCKPLRCHGDVIVELLNMVNVYSSVNTNSYIESIEDQVRRLIKENSINEKDIINIQSSRDDRWRTVVIFTRRNDEKSNNPDPTNAI